MSLLWSIGELMHVPLSSEAPRNRLLTCCLSPQCHRMPWVASHLSRLPCSNLSPLRAPERAPCCSFRGTPTPVALEVTLSREWWDKRHLQSRVTPGSSVEPHSDNLELPSRKAPGGSCVPPPPGQSRPQGQNSLLFIKMTFVLSDCTRIGGWQAGVWVA